MQLVQTLTTSQLASITHCHLPLFILKIFLTQVRHESGDVNMDAGVACGDITKLNVASIKSMCLPAPYGDLKTMQTKLDPSVRLALECNSDRFPHFS